MAVTRVLVVVPLVVLLVVPLVVPLVAVLVVVLVVAAAVVVEAEVVSVSSLIQEKRVADIPKITRIARKFIFINNKCEKSSNQIPQWDLLL